MDGLVDAVDAVDPVANSAADRAYAALVVFGLCFVLAYVIHLLPVRKS